MSWPARNKQENARVLPHREAARKDLVGLLRHEGTVAANIADFSLADHWEAAKR